MPIQVNCSNAQCRQPLACPDELAGQLVSCPKCGSNTQVPAAKRAGPTVNNRLGQYVLTRKIGEGGMGVVYEGVQDNLNRRVAIKVLHQRVMSNNVFVERFQREAKAAAALNHPNIVTVYDIGQDRGLHYFSMEFVDGETLHKRLKREGKLPVDEALSITAKVADALNYAWNRWNIIHRDIKPDNIMMTKDGQVKVADLGLAKSTKDETSVTMTGTGIGTPAYMSPEQGRGAKDVDCRADIYSLGITLFHLITGQPPYSGDTALSVMMAHTEQPLPNPKKMNSEIPDNVCHLLERMCAKDAAHRYQTPEELLESLEKVQAGQPIKRLAAAPQTAREAGPAAGERRSRLVREKPKKSRALLAVGAVLVLSAAAAAVFYVRNLWDPGHGNDPGVTKPGPVAQAQPGTPENSTPPSGETPNNPEKTPAVSHTTSKPPGGGPLATKPPGEKPAKPAATPASLFNEAEEFAKENPDNFGEIFRLFGVAKEQGKDTEYEFRAEDQLKAWQAKWEAAAYTEYKKRKQEADGHLKAGRKEEAAKTWEDFPPGLLTDTVSDLIEQETQKVAAQKTNGQKETTGPGTSSSIPELSESQIETFAAIEANLMPHLKTHNYVKADTVINEQTSLPKNGAFLEDLEPMREDFKAIETLWQEFLQAVEKSVGADETLGLHRGKVLAVSENKIVIEEKGAEVKLGIGDLRANQVQDKLKISLNQAPPEQRYALGTFFLHEGRKDKAREIFDTIGDDFPGVTRQRRWIELSKEAEAAKAIEDVWAARDAKNFSTITKLVSDVLQKHADTQSLARQREELVKLKESATGAIEEKEEKVKGGLDRIEVHVKRGQKELDEWRDRKEEEIKRRYDDDMTDSQTYERNNYNYGYNYGYSTWKGRCSKTENLKVLKSCLDNLPNVTDWYDDVGVINSKKSSIKKEIDRLEKEIGQAKRFLESNAGKLRTAHNKKKQDLRSAELKLSRKVKAGEELLEDLISEEIKKALKLGD